LEIQMVKIKFTAQGSNAMIGGFTTGDIANVGEAIAKHLVEEAQVAKYVSASEPVKPKKPAKPAKAKPADEPVVVAADAAVPPAPTIDEPAEE
jgi:hypothetical protein